MSNNINTDVLIIGAGAAGLMCALSAGGRGRRVMVLEHTDKIGEKIRISGGGRCNFTNLYCAPDRYISGNRHFCTSALKRFSQHDFIAMVDRHGIGWHEKTLGQLFCDNSATDIIDMLVHECDAAGVTFRTETAATAIERHDAGGFRITTGHGIIETRSLVVASGGLSIPKIGASPFGYRVAEQFGLRIVPTRAGLVPLTFDPAVLDDTRDLSGVAVDPAEISSADGTRFHEALLFTHRGISGPAVLQISSYWHPGEDIVIDLCPGTDIAAWLKDCRTTQGKAMLHTVLAEQLPRRLAERIATALHPDGVRIADLSAAHVGAIAARIGQWRVKPSGSEGYRTAEVTLGGVDTDEISSKTFEAKSVPGLYFIGEVLDVTGHLGGFNFQWAWSSGWCAGQFV